MNFIDEYDDQLEEISRKLCVFPKIIISTSPGFYAGIKVGDSMYVWIVYDGGYFCQRKSVVTSAHRIEDIKDWMKLCKNHDKVKKEGYSRP